MQFASLVRLSVSSADKLAFLNTVYNWRVNYTYSFVKLTSPYVESFDVGLVISASTESAFPAFLKSKIHYAVWNDRP